LTLFIGASMYSVLIFDAFDFYPVLTCRAYFAYNRLLSGFIGPPIYMVQSKTLGYGYFAFGSKQRERTFGRRRRPRILRVGGR